MQFKNMIAFLEKKKDEWIKKIHLNLEEKEREENKKRHLLKKIKTII